MAKSKEELAQDYTDIKTQAGLKLVRQIPGNYVGATRRIEGEKNSQALLQILQEVLSNSVDEARSGFGKLIDITIHADNSVSVTDQGRGIPMGKNFDKVRRSLTVLGSSGKYDSNAYANSAGLHGEGVKACNALSDYIDVWSRRLDGTAYHVKYHMEEPLVQEVLPMDQNKQSGTKVTFLPDKTVFDTIDWDDASVIHRIEQTIYLTPGVKFLFTDERKAADDLSLGSAYYHREWLSKHGLADYVAHVAESANLISGLSKPIAFSGEDRIDTTLQATGGNEYGQKFAAEFGVQGALLYTENSGETVASFVNGVPTVDGGTHETGAKSAVFQAIRDYAAKQSWYKKSQTIEASDTRDGLILMISVSIPHEVLSFDSQTKTKLSTPEARTAVFNVIYDQLIKYLSDHPEIGKSIVEAILDSRRARLASKNERKAARALRKNKRRGHLSEKVKPASSHDPKKKSLFITEGDSASALLTMVRDKRYQAVLPIRGKILNVWKANSSKALANSEITDITQVLGAGFGKDFNIDDLQYDRVIIGSDSDDDGDHIASLLITLFYKCFPGLIEGGHLYRVIAPLYQAVMKTKNGHTKYVLAYSEEEHSQFLQQIEQLKADGYQMVGHEQRWKGLGSMNREQTRRYLADPRYRKLYQIKINDEDSAKEMINIWMGRSADLRKKQLSQVDFDKIELD